MASVTGTIKVQTSGSQVPSAAPGTVTSATVNQTFSCAFQTSGTAADAVDLMYTKTLSLAATPTTLDLTSLTDIYGGAVNMARVRSITIKMKSTTNADTLTISPGASNGWTALLGTGSTLILRASTSSNDSMLILTAPSTTAWVTSGTSKTLTLDPGSSTFSVDIEIKGASA